MPIDAAILSDFPGEELNALLLSILSNSSDGIAFITPDYKVRYANERIARMAEVPLETVIGCAVKQLAPGWSRQLGYIYEEVRRTGRSFESEANPFYFESRPERGLTYWNSTVSPANGKDGKFLGWILMLREVAGCKTTEEERTKLLQEKETQIKLLTKIPENSPAGIALLDGLTFTVKWANKAYLAFLAKPVQINDLIGQPIEEYIPEEQKITLLNMLRGVATTGEAIRIDLYQQGQCFWNLSMMPIANQYAAADLMIVTYDITERVINRQRVEEYARQAENHLRQLEAVIESLEDGVIIFDLHGRILKQNTAARRILQYDVHKDSPAYLAQVQTDLQLYDLYGKAIPLEEWPSNRIIRGEIVRNYEVAVRRISAGDIWYTSYNGTLIKDSDGVPILAVMMIRDISDRERLLRQLEQEQARLQAVLEQMPCGVVMFDAFSLKRVLTNKKYFEIWRSPNTAAEFKEEGRPGELFRSDGQAYLHEEIPICRSITHGDTVSNEEMICQRPDGSIVTVICNSAPILDREGKIIAGVVVFSDITELKEVTTKAALASQLQQIIEFLPDGTFVVNRERKIIAWNRAIELLTGIPKKDILGTEAAGDTFYDIEQLTLIDVIFDDKNNDSTIEKAGDVVSKQVLLAKLNQRENVVLDIKATPIRNEHGDIFGVIETIRDITHQKEIETENIRMQKLESLGILAGGIAHDFNNILAAILANLQLAVIKLQKHQDISEYLEGTIETARKASDLTKQLLTFAKGGAPVKKTVSIYTLTKDTVQFALSGSKVKAEYHFSEDLWTVDVDEGQITQVINNLTINAEQAMPTGGILKIYGKNVIFDTEGKYTPGKYVQLSLKDHGIGIPEAIINKIFDPFFTTKETGNGLGLSTSYSIIKKHNGYLEVESSPGIGATFYILLPISAGTLETKESQQKITSGGEAKILLMDDEDTIRNVGGEMLTCYGYQVTLASDGSEAVELYKKAKRLGEPFDVVIMDLTVPGGLGGIETINILRQIEPGIKAIISSGYANSPVTSDYERYGFSGIVTKPYKFEELIEVLNKVVDKKQLSLDLTYKVK
jgi:PAS domain S-box-containing protein